MLARNYPIEVLLLASLGAIPTAQAQTDTYEHVVEVAGRPAPLKIIIRREASVYKEPRADNRLLRQTVAPMQFFYVLPSPDDPKQYKIAEDANGHWYRVHTAERAKRQTQYGFIHSSDVIEWWHREALAFMPRGDPRDPRNPARQRVRFYENDGDWNNGFSNYPDPEVQDDEIAIAMEPKRLGNNGFVMPVIDAKPDQTAADGTKHDLFEVAFITIPRTVAGNDVVDAPDKEVDEFRKTLGEFKVDVVFCVDASGSMDPFIAAVVATIEQVSKELGEGDANVKDKYRFGIVTYQGPSEVAIQCTLSDGADHGEFLRRLRTIKATGGGADGEDVLGGVHRAVTGMDWSPIAFKTLVLVGDENGYDAACHPEWNSSKLRAAEIVDLAQPVDDTVATIDGVKSAIMVFAAEIMAENNGDVLHALRTQQFSTLTKGFFEGRHLQLQPGNAGGFKQELLATIRLQIGGAGSVQSLITGGSDDIYELDVGAPEFAGVPRPFVVMMEMLKPQDDSAGRNATRMHSGWVSGYDTYGAKTVKEKFLTSKRRCKRLENTLSFVAGEIGGTDINAQALVANLQQRLAAVGIDRDISPTTPLSEVFQIVGGLPITTKTMSLTPEQIAAQTAADRKRMVENLDSMAKRLREQTEDAGLWFDLPGNQEADDAVAFIEIVDVT